ncbi:MAG: signal peptidase I [Phycisphaeraceae bacterium]
MPETDFDAPHHPVRSRLRRLWIWARPMVFTVLVVASVRSAVADYNPVPTGSMLPTIVQGDHITVNKLAYGLKLPLTNISLGHWSEPERGDVVTFWSPEDGQRMVKRVVGLPGDTVALADGRLIVNSQFARYSGPLGRTAVRETIAGRTHLVRFVPTRPVKRDFGPVRVPPGHYFMLGDNRDNSRDSRFFGTVPGSAITGEAFGVALSLDPGRAFAPRWDRCFSDLD